MAEELHSDGEFLPVAAQWPAGHYPLVAIVGPTASGKSALAVALAKRFAGEVVACDSAQVYRHFDIGTAKPTAQERAGVPHHLIDVVAPDELFTAGEYRLRATAVLSDLRRRAKLPVLTVGTGLYLRALLEGLADAPARSADLRIRLDTRANARGSIYLHRLLQRLDGPAANRISPNDRQKLIRAIEICLLTGKPVTQVHCAGREALAGYAPIKIGLNPPRALLYERIRNRIDKMIERGLLEEVSALLAGQFRGAKPFEFIGYKEIREHLEAGRPFAGRRLEQTIAAISQATRRYAKRQLTWFRKEANVQWLAGFGDDPKVTASSESIIDGQLRNLRSPETWSAEGTGENS